MKQFTESDSDSHKRSADPPVEPIDIVGDIERFAGETVLLDAITTDSDIPQPLLPDEHTVSHPHTEPLADTQPLVLHHVSNCHEFPIATLGTQLDKKISMQGKPTLVQAIVKPEPHTLLEDPAQTHYTPPSLTSAALPPPLFLQYGSFWRRFLAVISFLTTFP